MAQLCRLAFLCKLFGVNVQLAWCHRAISLESVCNCLVFCSGSQLTLSLPPRLPLFSGLFTMAKSRPSQSDHTRSAPPLMGFSAHVDHCEALLFGGQVFPFTYPDECRRGEWDRAKITAVNEVLLSTLRWSGNVYALFARSRSTKGQWELRYIGESKSESLRDRIRGHLIAKHHKTQSQLTKVQQAVRAGDEIGFSFVLTGTESLRLAVEEELINRSIELGRPGTPRGSRGRSSTTLTDSWETEASRYARLALHILCPLFASTIVRTTSP